MKVVLYHSNCQDGFFAAATLYKKFGKEALYIPVNYKPIQDITPEEALAYIFNPKHSEELFSNGNSIYTLKDVRPENYKDVSLFIVDYSFPVGHLEVYSKLFKSILTLDHHVTAAKAYGEKYLTGETKEGWLTMHPSENTKLVFSEKDSGAMLVHRYFNPEEPVPYFIELVSDRDLWQFKKKETDLFHYGVRLLNEENIQKVLDYATTNFEFILHLGELQKKEVLSRIKKTKRHGVFPVKITLHGNDYKGAIVNSSLDIASDLCNSVIKDGYDIAIAYSLQSVEDVSFSVRSAKGVDSSKLSLHFGGGGHAQASGFHASVKMLFEMMQTQSLTVPPYR